MKAPSKTKLGFDFALGGFMVAAAVFLRPYDFDNIVIAGIGLIWIADAAVTLDRHF